MQLKKCDERGRLRGKREARQRGGGAGEEEDVARSFPQKRFSGGAPAARPPAPGCPGRRPGPNQV